MVDISKEKVTVLDTFEERTDQWSWGDFESALERAMGNAYGNYQTAKMTIIEADQSGRWPKTVERYLRSNYKSFGNLPTEMNAIGVRLGIFEPENGAET